MYMWPHMYVCEASCSTSVHTCVPVHKVRSLCFFTLELELFIKIRMYPGVLVWKCGNVYFLFIYVCVCVVHTLFYFYRYPGTLGGTFLNLFFYTLSRQSNGISQINFVVQFWWTNSSHKWNIPTTTTSIILACCWRSCSMCSRSRINKGYWRCRSIRRRSTLLVVMMFSRH